MTIWRTESTAVQELGQTHKRRPSGHRFVVHDLAAGQDQVAVPLGRARGGADRHGALRQPQVPADVPDHLRRHLVQHREVAEPVDCLQDQRPAAPGGYGFTPLKR